MADMDSTAIIEALSRTVPAAGLEAVKAGDGMPTIYVALEQLVDTCFALRDLPELRFAFLADLLPVDYLPREPRFEVVYLLASLGTSGFGETAKRLRVKVRVPAGEHASLPSVSSVWPAANWSEREAYDLFGHPFRGSPGSAPHPDAGRLGRPSAAQGLPGPDQDEGEGVRAAAGLEGAVRRQHRGDERAGAERLMEQTDAEIVTGIFNEAIAVHTRVRGLGHGPVLEAARAISSAFDADRKLLIFGNGGSAADAQHMATELVVRFVRERRALPAVALSADTSVITATANDYAFDRVFARQIEALGRSGDVAFAISTSGGSPNVIAAVGSGDGRDLTMALTGRDGGALGQGAEVHINVPDASTLQGPGSSPDAHSRNSRGHGTKIYRNGSGPYRPPAPRTVTQPERPGDPGFGRTTIRLIRLLTTGLRHDQRLD